MLVRIACFAALGGFLFGYDLGLIGGAMLEVSRTFNITSSGTKEAIVGAAKLGAFFGTFLGGAMMLRYGRRIAMASNSLFFTVGPVIMAAAWGPWGLIAGRLVAGLGIGSSAIVAPAYLAEIAPAKQRGAVVQTYEMMLTIGMLLAVLFDWALSSTGSPNAWRWMVGLPALPGAVLGAGLVLLPESPRWLVMRGQLECALATIHDVLRKASGSATEEDAQLLAQAEDELLLLWSSVEKEQAATAERLSAATQRRLQQGKYAGVGWLPATPAGGEAREAEGVQLVQQPTGSSNGHSSNGYQPPAADIKQQQPGSASGQQRQQQNGAGPIMLHGPSAPSHVFQLEDEESLAGTDVAANVESTPTDSRRTTIDEAGGFGDSYNQQLLPSAHEHSSSAAVGTGSSSPHKRRWQQHHQQPEQQQRQRAAPGQEATPLETLVNMLRDIKAVATGPERRAFALAAGLAVFDQATASTAIINYAPEVLQSRLGVTSDSTAILLPVAIALTKVAGVAVALLVVDSAGRRPLLIWGGAGCAASLALAVGAVVQQSVALYIVAMCAYILAFSLSWAGLYWVVVSELFSMGAKSPAISASTSLLFLTGSLVNFVFLSMIDGMGAYAFLAFAVVAAASAVYVAVALPETKGRTLAEVQALLADDAGGLGFKTPVARGSESGNVGPSGRPLSGSDGGWVDEAAVGAVGGSWETEAAATGKLSVQRAWAAAQAARRRWFGGWGRAGLGGGQHEGVGAEEGVQMMGLALPLGMELGHQRPSPGLTRLETSSGMSRESEPL